MKKMILLATAILSLQAPIAAMAQPVDSTNYNLLQGPLDQQAAMARAAVGISALTVRVQLAEIPDNSRSLQDPKLCFRIGMFVDTVLASAVRYERHSTSTARAGGAIQATRIAVALTTVCGFEPRQVFNPEYLSSAMGPNYERDLAQLAAGMQTARGVRDAVDEIVRLVGNVRN